MTKFKLNKQQQEAVEKKDGAYSIIAAAGSGKTAILLERTKNLVKKHNVLENQILLVTFTRNTADDMINRLKDEGLSHVNVGTFHSIAGQILRKEGIDINGSNMIQEWQIDNVFKAIDQKADSTDIMNWISFQKNRMKGVDDEFDSKSSEYSEDQLKVYYKAYENFKDKQGLYDFDDYLLLCLEVVESNPGLYTYDYILVDEHQDSNKIQNLLLEHWSASGNVFVVGDFRQNIFSFRSSDNSYLMHMDKYWKGAETLNVHINYRSPKNIVDNANQFIKQYYSDYEYYVDSEANNKTDGHIEINSHPNRDVESVEVVNKIQKLINNGVELKDIAVLYRNNKHADFVENELKRRKIDYEIANDGSFFKRREIAGILSFLRLLMDTDDDSAFEGVFRLRTHPLKYFSNNVYSDIQNHANREGLSLFKAMLSNNYPKNWHMKNAVMFRNGIMKIKRTYDGDKDINVAELIERIVDTFKIRELIREKYSHKPERDERLESIDVLKSFTGSNNLEEFIAYVYSGNTDKRKKKDNAVQLMTIHRSKGLEWDNVFLVGIEDGEFPSGRNDVDIVEEARLMYVGVTRSKKNLWINEIGGNNTFVQEYGYDNENIIIK